MRYTTFTFNTEDLVEDYNFSKKISEHRGVVCMERTDYNPCKLIESLHEIIKGQAKVHKAQTKRIEELEKYYQSCTCQEELPDDHM